MKINTDDVKKILNGEDSVENLSESKDKLSADVVTAFQGVLSQIKEYVKSKDYERLAVLLSEETQEDEKNEDDQEDAPKEEVKDDESEEAKIELSAMKSLANEIEGDLNALDTEIQGIKDRDVARRVGAKVQSLFDRIETLK